MNDLVLIWLYQHICVEIAYMYVSVIGDSCSIMSNNYELTMNDDKIASLGKN